jgi:hypothetical protein
LSLSPTFLQSSKVLNGGKAQKKEATKSSRKKNAFKELSNRGQFLIAKDIRENYEPEALQLAASQTLSTTGKKDARFVFNKVNSSTGLTAAKIRRSIETKNTPLLKLAPLEGLAFLLIQNLTNSQYKALRLASNEKRSRHLALIPQHLRSKV